MFPPEPPQHVFPDFGLSRGRILDKHLSNLAVKLRVGIRQAPADRGSADGRGADSQRAVAADRYTAFHVRGRAGSRFPADLNAVEVEHQISAVKDSSHVVPGTVVYGRAAVYGSPTSPVVKRQARHAAIQVEAKSTVFVDEAAGMGRFGIQPGL